RRPGHGRCSSRARRRSMAGVAVSTPSMRRAGGSRRVPPSCSLHSFPRSIAMTDVRRTPAWEEADHDRLLTREWLVTNGLGGYASGSVAGAVTRRYHGLLVAALPAPLGRTVMLNYLAEDLGLPGGRHVSLGGMERSAG